MENPLETHNQSQKSTSACNWGYRRVGFANLLRMGHCAPTVMKTILDITSTDGEWLVKLSAGMPGGIGNTGFECGGLTSPLVLMGTQFSLRKEDRGLPVIFDKGHALCQNFIACHHTLQCREIRGTFWLHFPAILKGWFERVFSYGDAYALTRVGWGGEAKGRVPLLHHEKALVISTTLFKEEDYKADWEAPMTRIIDDWGLRYPGVKNVEHVYFYGVGAVDAETRQGYLERAYKLGKEYCLSE